LLNPLLAQFGVKQPDAHRDSFEASGNALLPEANQIGSKLPPSTTHFHGFGKQEHYPSRTTFVNFASKSAKVFASKSACQEADPAKRGTAQARFSGTGYTVAQ
jgi:hypothetical protein